MQFFYVTSLLYSISILCKIQIYFALLPCEMLNYEDYFCEDLFLRLSLLHSLGSDVNESLDHSDHTFKPGWNDIFRMNQNELEAEIRKVSRDSTLDPRRKAYLIQNLMTRFCPVIIFL